MKVLEIRTLKKLQHGLSPRALARLLAEDEMALGLPCVVDSTAEAVRLLGLRSSQVSALERALERDSVWTGVAGRGLLVAEGSKVCIRTAQNVA